MDNELEIKLIKESSDLSVFDKHPQQVLRFCATFEGEEYFFEGVVTIERNMFKKLIEFEREYQVFVDVYFRRSTYDSVSICIGVISEFEIFMNVEIIISRIMERNDMTMFNVLSELSNV